jgi:hypothetical protein
MGCALRRWALLALVAGGRVAAANPALDEAHKDIDSSDYMAARTALDQALHGGGATPEDLAEIYKLTGIVEGALGEDRAANEAFARWLELDPKGELPTGTSPKIERPFKSAARHSKPLDLKADTSATPPTVTLVVVSDRGGLVAHVHVIAIADGAPEQAFDGAPGVPIALPVGHRIDLRVQALDANGNRVFELGSTTVPLVITGSDARTKVDTAKVIAKHDDVPRKPRPWYFQWWAWGGATVAFAIAGGVFAWETHSELDRLDELNRTSIGHPFSDAQSTSSAAERDVLIADVAAGAAGVFALGTAILYLTRPRLLEHAPVGLVPLNGGGALVLGGHF